MACSILEITYSKFISDADGNLIRAVLLCDTAAELPGTTDFSGYTLIQGSTCHVIDDNQDYMLDSSGSWHPYGGEMWQNVYTKSEADTLLAGKQDALDAAQLDAVNSGITAAKLTVDEAAIVDIVDSGAKNIFATSTTSSTIVDCTFTNNGDGTWSITADGNVGARRQKPLSFTVPATLPSGDYVLSGCPSEGASGTTIFYCLYVWDVTENVRVSNNDVGRGVAFSWNPEPSHTYTIVIDIRNGTNPNDLIFKPMISTKTLWDISHEFVSYCPSMQELYQMIQALQ